MMTNTLLIVAAGVLVAFIVRETRKRVVIFDRFTVPAILEQQGYSGDVVGMMVADRFQAMRTGARSYMQAQPVISSADEAPDVEVPKAGLSLQTVLRVSRTLLGYQPIRVNGSVTVDNGFVILRVRVINSQVTDTSYGEYRVGAYAMPGRASGGGETRWPVAGERLNALVDSAAQAVLARTQPYMLAAYAHASGDSARVRALVAYVLTYAPAIERAYAHNLLGNILLDGGETDAALIQYRLAAIAAPRLVLPFFNMAKLYYLQRQFLTAERILDSALARDPRYAGAVNLKGLLLQVQQRYREAETMFAYAARLDPSDGTYVSNWANLLAEEGRREDALLKYQDGIARLPEEPSLLFGFGRVLWRDQQTLATRQFVHGLALVERRRTRAGEALDVSGYALFAELLHQARRDSAGAAVLTLAVRLDAIHAAPHAALGDFLFRTGNRNTAEAHLARAAGLEPGRADAFIVWGRALRGLRDWKGALGKYREAMLRAPTDVRGFFYSASVMGDSAGWLMDRHFDKAAERLYAASDSLYGHALRLDSSSIDIRLHWASDLANQGRYGKADTLLSHALMEDPWNARLVAVHAFVQRRMGSHADAIANYARSYQLDSAGFVDYSNWAHELLELGRNEEAAQRYAQASALGRIDESDQNNWGVALERSGKPDSALVHYQLATRDPTLSDAFFNLGSLVNERGDSRQARDLFRRAIVADSGSSSARKARLRLAALSTTTP